jgi:hypothetical protein
MGVVLVFWANGGAFSTSSSAMKGWCVVEAIRRQHAGHEDPRRGPLTPVARNCSFSVISFFVSKAANSASCASRGKLKPGERRCARAEGRSRRPVASRRDHPRRLTEASR